ncbi:hypothetical protein H257_09182 [Aphanomyces astaci]|uniref:Uncharacterized protein n=1 Tax=Aphanomyces astaci TaxID=112090 RepID=W4GAJ3_APHAT|nr:hypothetical protein H257_09182 [Aphanomyces astaci]ETV76707.1 hypothetical protein H257_09182 [Aphanomyces astaci]|eukprot:XP_009833619.1 hypothetical protein H257_09182 [Aphanomyces astaci]
MYAISGHFNPALTENMHAEGINHPHHHPNHGTILMHNHNKATGFTKSDKAKCRVDNCFPTREGVVWPMVGAGNATATVLNGRALGLYDSFPAHHSAMTTYSTASRCRMFCGIPTIPAATTRAAQYLNR